MELKSSNKIELKYESEKGDYTLSLPIGAPIEEVVKVCAGFGEAIMQLNEKYKKEQEEKVKEQPSEPVKEDKEEKCLTTE